MPVTDEQMATLRAQLAGDFDEHRRRFAELDKAQAKSGYTALLAAAFFEAVERRFTGDDPTSEVIQYVADVRARSDRLGADLDPTSAERVILYALGRGEIDDLDGGTIGSVQNLILTAIILDEKLDETALDEFLAKARALAES